MYSFLLRRLKALRLRKLVLRPQPLAARGRSVGGRAIAMLHQFRRCLDDVDERLQETDHPCCVADKEQSKLISRKPKDGSLLEMKSSDGIWIPV